MAAQVAGVKNNLGSVYRICQSGNRVVFDEDGSYIENKKTGKQIKVKMGNGAFEFDLWAAKAKNKAPEKRVIIEDKNRFKPLESDEEMLQATDEEDDDKIVEMVFRRRD